MDHLQRLICNATAAIRTTTLVGWISALQFNPKRASSAGGALLEQVTGTGAIGDRRRTN